MPAWRVLLPGRLCSGFGKVGGWLCSVPGHLCSPSHSAAWRAAEMLGLGCACLPLCVTKGKPLESVGPHTAEPGLGEIFSTGLEMWFHLPWLEVSPHFLRLSLGEGCPEGWCMVVCRSQVPFRLWKVVVPGGTCGARVGWTEEEFKCQTAALCDRPPRSSLRPGGPLGSLVAPASGDVEGVQGPAGGQGKVVAIPSGACGRAGTSGCLLRLFPRLA